MILWYLACFGVNTAKIPNQEIYADNQESKELKGPVHFAVVGDSRDPLPLEGGKRLATPDTRESIVKDISEYAQDGGLQFMVHLGDMVGWSATSNWKRFSDQWALLLSGTSVPQGAQRIRGVPVAGNHETVLDSRLKGFGAAWQGVGADIGYNRVASWYEFDLVVDGHTWRMLVLDTNKKAMGSRWLEQKRWLENTALKGDYDSMLVFMHAPVLTLGAGHPSNEEGAPKELWDIIEDQTRIATVAAVFASHNHTNEALLPGGKLGELSVNAGGGGAPADSLARWGPVSVPGYDEIRLEPVFDVAMVREFSKWAEERKFPQEIVDKGRGEGSYKGFQAVFDAHYFPIQGWWEVTLGKDTLDLNFRMINYDGQLKDVYLAHREGRNGWKIGK